MHLIMRGSTLIVLMYRVHITSLIRIAPCTMDTKIPKNIFTWNKSHLSPLDYQQVYCPMRCNGETRVKFMDLCWNVKCSPCYCQRPACEIYDNCCPDINVSYQKVFIDVNGSLPNYIPSSNTSIGSVSEVISTPVLGCDLVDGKSEAYLYIRSCSSNYTENKTMVDMCERDREKQEETIETFLRVVDLSTHVVYKNMLCAMCNNVVNFTFLPSEISSDSLMNMYKTRDLNELLRLQLKNYYRVKTKFPKDIPHFECLYSGSSLIIDKCSLCNKTNDIDEDIVNACENWKGNSQQVYDAVKQTFYKNIFCAICNQSSFPKLYDSCICHSNEFKISPLPFKLLLNFKHTGITKARLRSASSLFKTSNCSSKEWPSPGGNCVPLFCSAGKKLHHNQCAEILEEIKGLRYRLCLWMIPLYSDRQRQKESPVNTDIEEITAQIEFMMSELSQNFVSKFLTVQSKDMEMLQRSHIFLMECTFIATNLFTRNQLEETVLNKFINSNISIVTKNNKTHILQTYIIFPNLEVMSEGIENYIKRINLITFKNTLHTRNVYPDKTEKISINISHILLCQHVKFDVTKYEMNIDYNFLPPNITITIDLNVTKINITDLKDFSMMEIDEDGGLKVCQDLLDSKLKADKDNIQQDLLIIKLEGTSLAQYIVSIMCCVASIVCLLLTLLTYFMFPVLRTEAGINNMFLSFSLLLAQISLLVTSHIFRSSVMCTVIGITTHLLWLLMFSWSFICSYHMFRVFTDNTRRNTTQREMSRIWKKTAISFIMPIAITLVTIVYSYFTSDGQEIGYGKFSCYLNSPLLVGVTLVGPLSITTLSNVLFFLIAVYKIHQVRKLQASLRNDDQNQSHWYVYVRLSSVTGAFWTVAIIAEVMDSNILKFISIILNGLQGVAIFMSFICNKRVFYLYSQLRKPKRVNERVENRINLSD